MHPLLVVHHQLQGRHEGAVGDDNKERMVNDGTSADRDAGVLVLSGHDRNSIRRSSASVA